MAQEITTPGAAVMFAPSVSDNGEGMTPEAQKRAFEPFFHQAQHTTGWAGNGVRSFVKRHHAV
jgi:signal transduction histidine kinase